MLGIARNITRYKHLQKEIASSNKRLQSAFRATILALASVIEKRDPYTAGHQLRVAQLSLAIAKEMGLSKDSREGIRMAGIVHDIGKIQVPIDILVKPGKLTEEEFKILKTHPKVGYEILKAIDFPFPVAQIVFQHHERMDESGYPEGITGEKILLEARIIGVADVFEAMCSHRPYRPALGYKKALAEIKKNSGILYDPEVVTTCVKLFSKKKFRFKANIFSY